MLEYLVTGAVSGLILGTCAAVSLYRQRLNPPQWWDAARLKVFNQDTRWLCFTQFGIGGAVGFVGGFAAVLAFKTASLVAQLVRFL